MVLDRGTMDNFAYIKTDSDIVMQKLGLDLIELRETRYDMVIHMKTAADGAEEFYSLENNQARSESKEEAIELDKKIQAQWEGHHNFQYFFLN